jgi:DNA end-binding protein Ku
MPLHAIGSATISFGLVSVPVKLFATSESRATISFNLLHKECGSRLKQQYLCPKDGKQVPKEDMAKGYEFTKGQYVVFSPDELKALEEKATNSIDIAEFVPLGAVERIYLDRAYYLSPDKGGERAYRLLVEALKDTGRAGLGQYAVRSRWARARSRTRSWPWPGS